jgi:hypothetical protein
LGCVGPFGWRNSRRASPTQQSTWIRGRARLLGSLPPVGARRGGESLSQPPSLSCFLEPFCARERWRLVGWRCTLFLARWRNHGPSGPTRVHAHGIQSSVGQGRLMRGVCSGDRRRQEEGARRVGCVGGHAAHQDVSSRCSVRVCVGCKCACGRVAPLGRERLGG